MSNGAEPTAQAIPTAARSGFNRGVDDDLSFADRIFLAIENPVLRRELLTALRSNKAFILQGLFLLALGAVVYLAWPAELISTSAFLARKVFRTFGQSLLVLLSILSPAFSASAMTIEKEKRCIDLLLTSPIRPRTILMGKYISSVLYLLLLVISTAPLVTVIMWLPGLGPTEVAGLYVLLIAVAACFGMIGLTCSVFFHRSQASLAITYMIVLPVMLVLLSCAIGFDGFFLLESAIWPAGFLLIGTFIMYKACDARMRRPFDPVFRAAEEEDVATQTGLVLVRDRFPDNLLAPKDPGPMPDGGNPVYQKEIRCEIFGRGTLFLRLIIQISMFLSVVFLSFLYMSKEHIFMYYLVLFTMLVAPAFACNTITQERERGTLDLLLTTLLRPHQIITGKFISCLRLSLFLTGLVGVTMCFYVFVGTDQSPLLRALYLMVYLAILLITIVFETSLAMFFSLLFRSTFHSMITTYTALLMLFAAPVAVGQLLLAFTKMERARMFLLLLLSPFEAVYSVSAKTSGSMTLRDNDAMVWGCYLLLYLGLSVILMCYVYSSFERKSLETRKIE